MKSMVAFALSFFATAAIAQVGLGGGVVGTLGSNGSASRFGGMGSGISTGMTMRGEDLRQTGQLGAEIKGETRGNAAGSVDTTVKPGGASADVKAGGSGSASTSFVSGSSFGSAEANAGANTPNVKDTVRDTKAAARNKVDRVEEQRDKLENKGDKAADKALQ